MSAPGAGRVARLLLRHHGTFVWDGVLRGSAVLALAGIAVLEFGSPAAAGLVGFAVVTIWVNGPLGFFMPATYEPILMVFGRVYPPLLIGFVGILGILFVEFLKFHLHRRVRQLEKRRESPREPSHSETVGDEGRVSFQPWLEQAPNEPAEGLPVADGLPRL